MTHTRHSFLCYNSIEKFFSLKVYGLTRLWSNIQQCCNNFKRDNESTGCVEDEKLTVMETLKKIGVTDFKKILIRERIQSSDLHNVTVFATSNDMFRGLVGYKLTDVSIVTISDITELKYTGKYFYSRGILILGK